MSEKQEATIDSLSFEDALRELEVLVAQLEAGDLALEQSLAIYERGQKLAAHCSGILGAAELKVEQLTADGEIIEVDLE